MVEWITPGDAILSSGVLRMPSLPGLRASRGSVPARPATWQEAHDTVLLTEPCSAKNRIWPSTRLGSLNVFPAGWGPGGRLARATAMRVPTATGRPASRLSEVIRPARAGGRGE